jgi:WD40 repeat protein
MDDRERFRLLSEHFDATRDLAPELAEEYLGTIEDANLRREVREMLQLDRSGAPTVTTLVDLRDVVELNPPRNRGRWLGGSQSPSGSLGDGGERDPPIDLPAEIGGHAVLGVVGFGASGVVLKARQPSTERVVAVKVLGSGAWNPAAIQRFRREIRLLGRLEHAGIARVYDAGTDTSTVPSRPYFVMEFVDGVPLNRWARADGRSREPHEIARVFLAIVEAIKYAHANRIIHRDLKPGNVLVTGDGSPKVLDFGVSGVVDGAGSSAGGRSSGMFPTIGAPTAGDALVGTIPYMSPEQFDGTRGVDARSDLYSIGVMLFECLAGRLPYLVERRTLPEAAAIIRDEIPSTLGRVHRGLRGDLETVVARLLEKDPALRYQSAADLAADLRLFLDGKPTRARPVSRIARVRRFTRRYRGLIAATALAFATLIAVLGYVLNLLQEAEHRGTELAQALEITEQVEYRRTIRDAEAALRANASRDARRALERASPERRGWEWKYLASRAGAETTVVEMPTMPISIALGHDCVIVGGLEGSLYRLPRGLGTAQLLGRRGASISEVATSPDGTEFIAVDTSKREIPVLSTRDGTVVRSFDPQIGSPSGVAWSPDGRWIAIGSNGGALAILDAATGRLARRIGAISNSARGGEGIVRFLPDSAGVVFACRGTTRAMLLRSFDAAPIPLDLGDRVVERVGVCAGREGPRALVGLYTGEVAVFDGEYGESIRTIAAGAGALRALVAGPGPAQFATGATDGVIRVWDVDTGAQIGAAVGAELQVRGLAFDPERGELMSVGEDLCARSWDIDREVIEPVLRDARAWIYSLAFLADDTLVSGAGEAPATDGRVMFWPSAARKPTAAVNPVGPDAPAIVWAVAPDPLGGVVAVAGSAFHLIARDGSVVSHDLDHFPYAVATVAGGRLIAVAAFTSAEVGLYDRAGKQVGSIPLGTKDMAALATRGDGRDLFIGASGKLLQYSFEEVDELPAPKLRRSYAVNGTVTDLDARLGSDRLAVGLLGGEVALLDLDRPPSDPFAWRVPANAAGFTRVALSPDATRIASCGKAPVLVVLDASDGMQVLSLDGHGDQVLALAFSKDGSTLATGSIDGTIRLWWAGPKRVAASGGTGVSGGTGASGGTNTAIGQQTD